MIKYLFESIFLSAFKNVGNTFLLNYENQFKYHAVKKENSCCISCIGMYTYILFFFFNKIPVNKRTIFFRRCDRILARNIFYAYYVKNYTRG